MTKQLSSISILLLSISFVSIPLLTSSCTAPVEKPAAVQCQPTNKSDLSTVTLSLPEREKIHVTRAQVEKRTLPIDLDAAGTIEANANLTTPVLSLVGGRVEDMLVQLGDTVSAGQVIAKISSDDVAQVESTLLSTVLDLEASREQSMVELEAAQAHYKRQQVLFEEKISSRQDIEDAKRDFDKAQAAIRAFDQKRIAAIYAASERLKLFGVSKGAVDHLVKTHSIDNVLNVRAPRSGVIIQRDANPGQMIDNAHPLVVVSDLSKVWLVAQVFERDLKVIRLNDPVKVVLDSYPDEVFHGHLDYIGPKVDPQTRALPVRATIENKGQKIKPQMFARLLIHAGSEQILAIPTSAIQRVGETDIVYIATAPNQFIERKVTIGNAIGDFTEIKAGLQAHEIVVVNGSLQIQGEAILRSSR